MDIKHGHCPGPSLNNIRVGTDDFYRLQKRFFQGCGHISGNSQGESKHKAHTPGPFRQYVKVLHSVASLYPVLPDANPFPCSHLAVIILGNPDLAHKNALDLPSLHPSLSMYMNPFIRRRRYSGQDTMSNCGAT